MKLQICLEEDGLDEGRGSGKHKVEGIKALVRLGDDLRIWVMLVM